MPGVCGRSLRVGEVYLGVLVRPGMRLPGEDCIAGEGSAAGLYCCRVGDAAGRAGGVLAAPLGDPALVAGIALPGEDTESFTATDGGGLSGDCAGEPDEGSLRSDEALATSLSEVAEAWTCAA